MTTRSAFELAERYDRAVNRLESDAISRLNTALDASYQQLEDQLRQSYSRLQTDGSLIASQRRLLITDELGELLDLVKSSDEATYEAFLQELVQASDETGGTMAGQLIQAIQANYPLSDFARIQIEAAALQARDGVQRLRKHSDEFRGRASAAIEQGLIQGWGPGRVADVLRTELGATKGKAETIARTEISSALNDAAQQRYQDNGIEGMQLIVTPSEGLCPFCAARNGRVYKVGEMRVPLHPRCRCLLLPWSRAWQQSGLTDDAFIQDYRDRNLQALREDGQAPAHGPTYWEKKAGLEKAPKPIWSP
ncbi:MAG: minor capsid protein [Cyanobacteria bacterium P01_F01_bin.116]